MSNESNIDLSELGKRIQDILTKLDIPALRQELEGLTAQSADPELWSDEDRAKKVMSGMAAVRDSIDSTEKLITDLHNLEELVEMSKDSEDENLDEEIK